MFKDPGRSDSNRKPYTVGVNVVWFYLTLTMALQKTEVSKRSKVK